MGELKPRVCRSCKRELGRGEIGVCLICFHKAQMKNPVWRDYTEFRESLMVVIAKAPERYPSRC